MIILYGGDIQSQQEVYDANDKANDDYFTRNYDAKFRRNLNKNDWI